eukprot:g21747.t1
MSWVLCGGAFGLLAVGLGVFLWSKSEGSKARSHRASRGVKVDEMKECGDHPVQSLLMEQGVRPPQGLSIQGPTVQVPLQPMSSMAPMAALPNPILSAPAPAYYAGMNQVYTPQPRNLPPPWVSKGQQELPEIYKKVPCAESNWARHEEVTALLDEGDVRREWNPSVELTRHQVFSDMVHFSRQAAALPMGAEDEGI